MARAATLAEAGAPSVLLAAARARVGAAAAHLGRRLAVARGSACEGCRACSDACPVGLPAHALVATLAVARDDGSASRRAGAAAFAACTGCGCDAACPASLSRGQFAVDVRERLAAGRGVTAGATTLRAGIDRALLTLRLGLSACAIGRRRCGLNDEVDGRPRLSDNRPGCLVAGGYVWRAQARFAATAAHADGVVVDNVYRRSSKGGSYAPAVEFACRAGARCASSARSGRRRRRISADARAAALRSRASGAGAHRQLHRTLARQLILLLVVVHAARAGAGGRAPPRGGAAPMAGAARDTRAGARWRASSAMRACASTDAIRGASPAHGRIRQRTRRTRFTARRSGSIRRRSSTAISTSGSTRPIRRSTRSTFVLRHRRR